MNQEKGFSLIELMTSVAIMAILAMMALPSFNSLIAESRLRQGVESAATMMRQAQAKAIEVSAPVTVTVSGSEIVVSSATINLFRRDMPEHVAASGVTTFVFAPDGRASTSGILLLDSTSATGVPTKSLNVTPIGQIATSY